MTTVGIVGLGLLGSSIAARFVKAEHIVVGFDILPERVAALTAIGGKAAASSAEVQGQLVEGRRVQPESSRLALFPAPSRKSRSCERQKA